MKIKIGTKTRIDAINYVTIKREDARNPIETAPDGTEFTYNGHNLKVRIKPKGKGPRGNYNKKPKPPKPINGDVHVWMIPVEGIIRTHGFAVIKINPDTDLPYFQWKGYKGRVISAWITVEEFHDYSYSGWAIPWYETRNLATRRIRADEIRRLYPFVN